jgi:DNA-binding transcriptional LysR family regulator
LKFYKLQDESFALVCGRRHLQSRVLDFPLKGGKQALPFVCFSQPDILTERFLKQQGKQVQARAHTSLTLPSHSAMLDAVIGLPAFTVVPTSSIAYFSKKSELEVLDEHQHESTLYFVEQEMSVQPPEISKLRSFLIRQLREKVKV